MPAEPGIRLRFRVLLVPISEDGTERRDDAIDGGTTEVVLHLETGRPGPVMRDADFNRYVDRVARAYSATRDGDFGDASHEKPEREIGDRHPAPRGLHTPGGALIPETGDEYAARLEREDLTPHVSPGLPGTIPTPRDVPRRR